MCPSLISFSFSHSFHGTEHCQPLTQLHQSLLQVSSWPQSGTGSQYQGLIMLMNRKSPFVHRINMYRRLAEQLLHFCFALKIATKGQEFFDPS